MTSREHLPKAPRGSSSEAAEELSVALVRLTRAAHGLRQQLAAQSPDDIDWAAYALLFELVLAGPRRSSALAEAAGVDPSTVSRQVAQLVAAGLVERQPDPQDGRAVLLVATEAGHARFEAKRARRVQMFERILQGWSARDVKQLTDLLTKFNDSFAEVRPLLVAELSDDAQETSA